MTSSPMVPIAELPPYSKDAITIEELASVLGHNFSLMTAVGYLAGDPTQTLIASPAETLTTQAGAVQLVAAGMATLAFMVLVVRRANEKEKGEVWKGPHLSGTGPASQSFSCCVYGKA